MRVDEVQGRRRAKAALPGEVLRFRLVQTGEIAARLVVQERSLEAVSVFLLAVLVFPGRPVSWQSLAGLMGGPGAAARGLRRLAQLGVVVEEGAA